MDLQEIAGLIKEMEYLKKQIKSCASECVTTTDSVKGSSPFYPYIEHTIMITGIDDADLKKRVKQLKHGLSGKIQEIMDKVEQAQEYITTVPDADTRIILQCRYINGMTWEQIERDMGISEATAKRRFRKWRDNIK